MKFFNHVIVLFVLLSQGSCQKNQEKEPLVKNNGVDQRVEKPKEISPIKTYKSVKNQIKVSKGTEHIMKCMSAELRPKPQKFKINPFRDTLIKGNKGTQIFIPKGALLSDDNDLEISLHEAYSRADMLLFNLTTTSNGDPLASNGMIKLFTNHRVQINKEKPLKVKFPSTKSVASDLFHGKRTVDGDINWLAKYQESVPSDEMVFKNLEEPLTSVESGEMSRPISYKGEDTLKRYLKYPKSMRRRHVTGRVFIDLMVGKSGGLDSVRLVQGLRKDVDDMILLAVKKIKNWRPGYTFGKPTAQVLRWSFVVLGHKAAIVIPDYAKNTPLRERKFKLWQRYDQQRESKLINEEIRQKEKNLLRGYIYEITSWGWKNCDYYTSTPVELLTEVKLKPNEKEFEEIRLIVKGNDKSVFSPRGYTFEKIRNDVPITIIGSKKLGEDWYFASVDFDQAPGEIVELAYQKMTKMEIKKHIGSIK